MMKRLLSSGFFVILLSFVWNGLCKGDSPNKETSREEILAKVNGEPVTVGRFYDYLNEYRVVAKDPEKDEWTKENRLRLLLRQILIDQKAASLDMESDSLFVTKRNNHMREFLLNYMYQKDIVDKIEVTDQEVKDHYEKYKEVDFLIPEQVRVRDLLIRVRADSTKKDYQKRLKQAKKEAKEKIKKLYKRALAGEDFADLCKKYSETKGLDGAGDLGFIQKGRLSRELESAVFSLKRIGQISKLVKDSTGYHLIQLLDRKEKSYQELDSALFEGIREYLKKEKSSKAASELAEQLKAKTEFVYNLEVLKADASSFDKNTWVLAFGDGDTIRLRDYEVVLSGYRFDLGRDSLTMEEKKDLLVNQMAMPLLLEREAKRRGYADLLEYKAEERAFTLQQAKEKVLAERIRKSFPPPTMEEIKAYYQAHKIDFPPLGVPIHVYHIVFDDSQRAAEVLSQIRKGADFVQMAKKYFPGEEEIKDVVYDLGFITEGEMPDEFYQAALKLNVGEVSEPVKTKWGFHLIKVVEKKDQKTTFEDIIPQIQRAINLTKGKKHLDEWEKNLFDQADVWINKRLLKQLRLPKPPG